MSDHDRDLIRLPKNMTVPIIQSVRLLFSPWQNPDYELVIGEIFINF